MHLYSADGLTKIDKRTLKHHQHLCTKVLQLGLPAACPPQRKSELGPCLQSSMTHRQEGLRLHPLPWEGAVLESVDVDAEGKSTVWNCVII